MGQAINFTIKLWFPLLLQQSLLYWHDASCFQYYYTQSNAGNVPCTTPNRDTWFHNPGICQWANLTDKWVWLESLGCLSAALFAVWGTKSQRTGQGLWVSKLSLFTGHFHFQSLIACSMQIQQWRSLEEPGEAWESLGDLVVTSGRQRVDTTWVRRVSKPFLVMFIQQSVHKAALTMFVVRNARGRWTWKHPPPPPPHHHHTTIYLPSNYLMSTHMTSSSLASPICICTLQAEQTLEVGMRL